jgi:hypothetical protein
VAGQTQCGAIANWPATDDNHGVRLAGCTAYVGGCSCGYIGQF